MFVPSRLLKRIYTISSLTNTPGGVGFSVKNRLSDAQITNLISIDIDNIQIPPDKITLVLPDGQQRIPQDISKEMPMDFLLRQVVDIADRNTDDVGREVAEGFGQVALDRVRFVAIDVEDARLMAGLGQRRLDVRHAQRKYRIGHELAVGGDEEGFCHQPDTNGIARTPSSMSLSSAALISSTASWMLSTAAGSAGETWA